MTGKVSSPGIGSCWPSAIVRGTSIRTRSPAASERTKSSPASGSTPITRVSGDSAGDRGRAARRAGRRRRRQTSSTSSGPASSSSSSAAVPWPAMHARVVVGMDRDEPALGDERGQQRLAVLPVAVEAARSRRRSPRVAATLPAGASSGIRITAGTSCSRAASDSAWAWLPEETVATPRARSPGRQRGHRVVGAAELEGAGALEVLGLEQDAARRRSPRRASGR